MTTRPIARLSAHLTTAHHHLTHHLTRHLARQLPRQLTRQLTRRGNRRRPVQHPDDGYSTETVAVIAAMVTLAIAALAVLSSEVMAFVQGIDLNG